MISLERNKLVVLFFLSVSEIWPDKRVDLWCECLYKRGTTVLMIVIPNK